MKLSRFACLLTVLMLVSATLEARKFVPKQKPLDIKTFIELEWLSDIQVSPDSKTIAYTVTLKNIESNSTKKNIWTVDIESATSTQMTFGKESDYAPRWSPDGKTLAFISSRSGFPQIWFMNTAGGEAKQITDFAAGIDDFIFSPDSGKILFTSTLWEGCSTDKCVREKDKEKENNKANVRIITDTVFRHWKSWLGGKISRLFLLDIYSGKIRVISPEGLRIPPYGLSGRTDFAFSPDGKEIAYTTNTDNDLSRSTNNDIYVVSTKKGKPEKISVSKSNDNSPMYSPDGRYIAFKTQIIPGFESDKIRLAAYDRKKETVKVLTENYDSMVYEAKWAPDSKSLYFVSPERGHREIYNVALNGSYKKMSIKTHNSNMAVTPDGKYLVMLRQSFESAPEIFKKDIQTGKIVQLTKHNKKYLAGIKFGGYEEYSFKANDGTQIHGFFVFPPYFNKNKKYPWLYYIHGGPQGATENSFHPRWNMAKFASPGYVVAIINFRGSVGYGQDFTNQISKDYTGKPYTDIMEGLDWLLVNQKFLHKNRFCAAGASFGGFMMNYLEAKTDRFKCLISHAGVSDEISMYGTTEEKWFPQWDVGGTPYDNFDKYKEGSPFIHAKNFKTPILLLHGELDFRVPIEQAFEMYTAVKWAGVDTRMVLFPDEGHWIWKPANANVWWEEMLGWLDKYLK